MKYITEKRKLVVVKLFDAGIALFWGFGILFVSSGVLSVDDLSKVLFGLAIVNSFMILDIGFSGYLFAVYRKEFLLHGKIENMSLAGAFYLFFIIFSIIILGCSLLYSLALLEGQARFIFLGFAFYSVFALAWSVLGSVARSNDDHLRYFSVEALRKILAVFATGLMYFDIIAPSIFSLMIFLGWVVSFALMKEYVEKLIVSYKGVTETLNVLAVAKYELKNTSFFSVSSFAFFQVPYYSISFISGLGIGLVYIDIFNKFRRAIVVFVKMIVDIQSPSFTRDYHLGSYGKFKLDLILTLLLFSFCSIVSVYFIAPHFNDLLRFLAQGSDEFTDYEGRVLMISLSGFLLHITLSYFMSYIGKFILLGRIVFGELILSLLASACCYFYDVGYVGFIVSYGAIAALGAVVMLTLVLRLKGGNR